MRMHARSCRDAFVSAYKAIKAFEEKSRFSTWLYTIVLNLSRNRLKQIKTQIHHEKFSLDDPILTDNGNIKAEPVSNEPSVLEKLEKRYPAKSAELHKLTG